MARNRDVDEAFAQFLAPPTRSNTAPLPNLSSEGNLREDARRILEKFLQRELLKRADKGEAERKNDTTGNSAGTSQKSVDVHLSTYIHRSQDTQFTVIRSGFSAATATTSTAEPTKRQASLEIKSSQSTCSSSYDGAMRGVATDFDSLQPAASATAAGSLSSSSSSQDQTTRLKKAAEKKRKKSLYRRAKERLERTLSLKRRRAEEKAENRKMTTTSRKRPWAVTSENGSKTPAVVQRSNSEESTMDQNFQSRFSQMSVSSCPKGGISVKNGKRTRIRKQPTSTNGAAAKSTPDFLTPPDSGFRSARKRRDDGRFRRPAVAIGEALASGVKLLKKHSGSGSGCSPTKWLKRRDSRQKLQEDTNAGSVFGSGNGLEFLANSDSVTFSNSIGVLHRVGRLGNTGLDERANIINIQIEPATTSSSEPHSSLSPPWSIGDGSQLDSKVFAADGLAIHEAKGQRSTECSQSSQDRRSSDDMEEKYALIAQRLAELGDAFLASQWKQLRAESAVEEVNDEDAESKASLVRLAATEQDVVNFITDCDQTMQNSESQFQQGIVYQLVASINSNQFGHVLNSMTETNALDSEAMSWTRLAIIFHLTTSAVRTVGATTNAARRLIDYCCDYVTGTFSGWIIGQGGWSSVVEDQSSGEEDRSKR